MADAGARMTVLHAVAHFEGRWGKDRLERAFPPGWFADEPPNTSVFKILYALQREGLVAGPDRTDLRWIYVATDRGLAALREAGLDSTGPVEGRLAPGNTP
ncbi:hypothetical protein [Paludisphaera mucosa]|uniref:PadR family transcriptional regulator n=1 Tax=Paludisphaera mucosa TaxID=3030827 RepID=A0ABT6FKB9_9BACT|nr:hypothetical protein [Paludisphaera mucosa]MDG3008016.1 hypothetical protein [Paludisphaera mucosa]